MAAKKGKNERVNRLALRWMVKTRGRRPKKNLGLGETGEGRKGRASEVGVARAAAGGQLGIGWTRQGARSGRRCACLAAGGVAGRALLAY